MPWNHQWAAQSTLAATNNLQRKRKCSRRGHRCGVDQIPFDDQVSIVLNSRMLERVFLRTLICENIQAFIVEEGRLFLFGLEVFSL